MFRKTLCAMLALVMLLGMLPVSGFAAEEEFQYQTEEEALEGSLSKARASVVYESESNDSRSKADSCAAGNIYEGWVERVKDPNDWYKFSVSDYKYLRLNAVSAHKNSNKTKFYLYDSDGDRLKTSSYDGQNSYGDDTHSMTYSLSPGTYYIRVYNSTHVSGYYWSIQYQFLFYLENQLARPSLSASNNTTTGKPIISWKAISGASYYRVTRATSKSGTYKDLITTYGTSIADTTARAGKTYYYKVQAISGSSYYHDSKVSSYKSRACDCPRPDIAVTNYESSGKVKISWNEVDGADKYSVYCSTSSSGDFEKIGTTSKNYLSHSSGKIGRTYYYKVKAINEDNSSANSAYSSVKSGARKCARPDVSSTNKSSTGKPVVKWDKVSGADSYEVYVSTSENGSYSYLGYTEDTSLTHTNAAAGTKYYYKVRAFDDATETFSAWSKVTERTCDLPRPSISVELSSKKPEITWNMVDGAIGYNVYYSTNGDSWKLLKEIDDPYDTDLRHGSAKKGRKYYYRVKALSANSAANSANSSKKSITSK